MPTLTIAFSIAATVIFKSSNISPIGHAVISVVDQLPDEHRRQITVDCIRTPAQRMPSLELYPDELVLVADPTGLAESPMARGGSASIHSTYLPSGKRSASLGNQSAYTFVHRRRPLPSQPARFGVTDLTADGHFLAGKVNAPANLEINFAFIYWDGWFYELDGNLRVVRRSMRANDRRLLRRLMSKLPESIEVAGPLALARLTEQAARISISGTVARNRQLKKDKKASNQPLSALAPVIPEGYGMICVVSRPPPEKGSTSNMETITCYRQLFNLDSDKP
jgi:hypothetical protein